MSKIASKVNALKGCVINWCHDEEEKKAMFICCDQILEHVEKLEKQQECQLTYLEIEVLLSLVYGDLIYIKDNYLKNITKKLKTQMEMLKNVR